MNPHESAIDMSRRDFLQQAAAVTGLAALAPAAPAEEKAALLPSVKLGKTDVTRLIIGGNPIYGYAHFNKLLGAHQKEWHTPERVVALLKRVEEVGINTWQCSYHERSLSDLDRIREAGGRINWFCLGNPDWDQFPDRIEDAAKRKPIGIAPHGALAERLHRNNKIN